MAEKTDRKINLEDMSRDNPFKVPEHYFENFTVRMADKISQAEETKVFRPTFGWMRPQYAVVALASIALVVSFGIYFINHASVKHLSIKEISQNIEYSIVSEMDETELLGQLEEAENKSMMPADSLNQTQQEYSKQVIEYLSKEDIDINTIEDAL